MGGHFTNAFVAPARPIKGVKIVNKKYLLDLVCKPNGSNAGLAQVWENKETMEKKLL
jgi:hypothetical protein